MRAKALFAGSAILLAAAIVAIAAAQSAPPNSPASSSSPQPPQSGYVLQVKARAVTVDVVATDSHGNPVRDLKPEEFQVSDNGPQKIAHFAFIDKSAASSAAKTAEARPKGFYTNQAKFDSLTLPPTVILLDALNSDVGNLADARRHMLHLLKTLPANTPVAVFVLRHSLEIVQDFTSDPAVLSTALDKAMKSATPLDPTPGNDPAAPSLAAFDENGEDSLTVSLESFEKDNHAHVMDFRVRTTLDALRSIAHYLSGYPGRKNLIWVSASFPNALSPAPALGTGVSNSASSGSASTMAGDGDMNGIGTNSAAPLVTDSFSGTRSYTEEIQDPSNGLTDAHVAVYPVDARELETEHVYDADQDTVLRGAAGSRSMTAQLNREDDARSQSQETMDKLAEGTGGKTCKNANDLSACIETALKDSSSYYELAYDPQNAKWDGSFHTISVKTTRPGLNLRYRRGYFALNEGALANQQPPEKRLQQACQDYLPSTAIPITAQSVPSEKPDEIRYLMSVPAGALNLAPDGQSHKLSAEMATCVYSANGGAFRFTTRDLSRTLSDADFSTLQTSGLRGYLDAPKSGTERVRIALLDLGTGLTGSLDIAVHPEDFESAAAPTASPATSPAASASTAPAPQNPPSQPAPAYTITFHSSSGATSALDWSGDALSFHGDAAAARQFAPAFFHHVIDPKFRCQDGQLVPRDAGDATPNLHFSFKNPAGQTAIVDLTGSEPQYSGDLPMDPSAKPFFEALWNLCHCAAPHLLSVPLQRAGGGSILRADALRPF